MKLGALSLKRLQRDPRRTLQQAFGVGLVCALLIVWSTLTGGFSATIYRVATRLVLGHIQLHHPNYLTSESIYDTLAFDTEEQQQLLAQGYRFSYRLYQYALASQGQATKGARIVGLEAALEEETTDLPQHLAQGRFIKQGDSLEAVVASQLAEVLGVKLGSELAILGTAADGSLASEVFTVVGILKPVSQTIDQRYVYVDASAFRQLFSLARGVNEIVVTASGFNERPYVEPALGSLPQIFPQASIQTWRQLKPSLARILDLLSYTVYFTLGFVYLALGMLVLNLKLMTVFDRSREYGVMLALGMHPRQLVRVVLFESLWLGLLAGILAALLGIPCARYLELRGLDFHFLIDHLSYSSLVFEPILYGKFGWKQVLGPLSFLLVTLPLAALYPALLAARIQPSQAMQGKGSGL